MGSHVCDLYVAAVPQPDPFYAGMLIEPREPEREVAQGFWDARFCRTGRTVPRGERGWAEASFEAEKGKGVHTCRPMCRDTPRSRRGARSTHG